MQEAMIFCITNLQHQLVSNGLVAFIKASSVGGRGLANVDFSNRAYPFEVMTKGGGVEGFKNMKIMLVTSFMTDHILF